MKNSFCRLFIQLPFELKIEECGFPRCISWHPAATALEEWISAKDYNSDGPLMGPMWHVPSDDEVQFANELLNLHFQSALDDLLKICQNKIHSDAGNPPFF